MVTIFYFSYEINDIQCSIPEVKLGDTEDEIFPVLEIVAREVKNKVNEIGDTTKVVMRFSIDDKKYGVEVSGIEEESVFHNILSDSFYGMAATVMNHFGINDYIYPESFENAIYQRSGYDGKAEIG